jgi:hypothetical protein
MQRRSHELQAVISITLAKEDTGIRYERMVELIAPLVSTERAFSYRLNRLKRNPSETTAETIWEGQKALARKYIDAAHRYGRITYVDEATAQGRTRRIFPGKPASTGGRYPIDQNWSTEEREGSDTLD